MPKYIYIYNIVTGVLQKYTLAPSLFIICLDYAIQTLIDLIKEHGPIVKKEKRDKKQTIFYRNYHGFRRRRLSSASLSASSERTDRKIPCPLCDLRKIEFMCFKQDGAISALNYKSLKLIGHFTYLGSI